MALPVMKKKIENLRILGNFVICAVLVLLSQYVSSDMNFIQKSKVMIRISNVSSNDVWSNTHLIYVHSELRQLGLMQWGGAPISMIFCLVQSLKLGMFDFFHYFYCKAEAQRYKK